MSDQAPGDEEDRAKRLGVLVTRAMGRKGLSNAEAMEIVDISKPAWYRIVRGETKRPQARNAAAIEQLFGWRDGSIYDYLHGGPEPAPVGVVNLPGAGGEVMALLREELEKDDSGRLKWQVLRLVADLETESQSGTAK